MDGLAALSLLAGASTTALAGLVYRTWRRSARVAQQAVADVQGGALPFRCATDRVIAEEPAPAPPLAALGPSSSVEPLADRVQHRGFAIFETEEKEAGLPVLGASVLTVPAAASEPSGPPAMDVPLGADAGNLAETVPEDSPETAAEDAAESVELVADCELDAAENSVGADPMPPLPAEPQADGGIGKVAAVDGSDDHDETAEPRGGADEEGRQNADGGCDGKEKSASPELDLAEVVLGIEEGAQRGPRHVGASQPAVHRDRLGKRRPASPANALPAVSAAAAGAAARLPAEARLRLSLHPLRRTATLSVVLARPEGFPERVTPMISGQTATGAYDAQRYDDLDVPWTAELLVGEIRLDSAEGFQWLRSARQVHIFAEDPAEPDLISVGAARSGAAHAVICRSEDAAAVRAAAASTGSPTLTAHERWQGIPYGWVVLSDYRPRHAAVLPLTAALRPLDPGPMIEIVFGGGLAIRPKVFAEGHPPRIEISFLPEGASVTIDGQPAAMGVGKGWEASEWNAPGRHMVDVVPGPSLAYEIAVDPASAQGWQFWDAHAERFGGRATGAWARAEICGASMRGPAGQLVLAVEARPSLIALGARSGVVALQRRGDVAVSLALVPEPPAFLLSATGQRRTQGRVIWLGLGRMSASSERSDLDWAAAVRAAASRRLPLDGADPVGEQAWRKAKERARRLRRPRR
jgi:hypothetical protein